MKGSQGRSSSRNLEQELKQRPQKTLLTGLPLTARSAHLYNWGPSAQGCHCPVTLPHQSLIKKILTGLPIGQSNRSNYLSSFQICKVSKKVTGITTLWHSLNICVLVIGSLTGLLCILSAVQKRKTQKSVFSEEENGSQWKWDSDEPTLGQR